MMKVQFSIIGLLVLAASTVAAQSHVGCYRFDSPLGYSASGDRERADSAWYIIELREKGVVSRPFLSRSSPQEMWVRRSHWKVVGDTLMVRVHDGLVGWDISLLNEGNVYSGVAVYLTDVIVKDWKPPRVAMRATKYSCRFNGIDRP